MTTKNDHQTIRGFVRVPDSPSGLARGAGSSAGHDDPNPARPGAPATPPRGQGAPPATRLGDLDPGLLHQLLESTADGMVVFDDEGRVLTCNSGMALIVGRPLTEIVGQPAHRWGSRSPWTPEGDTAGVTSTESVITRPDGTHRRVHVRCFTVPGTDPPFRTAVYRDVTMLRRAESASRELDDRYRHLVENVSDGVMVHTNGRIVYTNEPMAEMLGYEVREMIMRPRAEFDAPSLPAGGFDIAPAAGAGGRVPDTPTPPMVDSPDLRSRYAATLHRRDGGLLEVEIASSEGIHEGEQAVFEVVRDVTERRRAERRAAAFLALGNELNVATTPREVALAVLRAADALMPVDACYLDILTETPDGPVLLPVLYQDTIDGRRGEVKPVLGLMGAKAALMPDNAPSMVLRKAAVPPRGTPGTPGTASPASTYSDEIKRRHAPFGDESRPSASLLFARIRAPRGDIGIFSVQSYTNDAYTPADLDVLQALADHCTGALERTRVQSALRDSEDRYRQMFQGSSAVKLLVDPADGTIIDANSAACDFYGHARGRMLKNTLFDMVVADREEITAIMERAAAGHPEPFHLRHRMADGSFRNVEVYMSGIVVDGRRYLHNIVHDVSDRDMAIGRGMAIAELGHRLSACTDVMDVARAVLATARRLIGWDAATMDLIATGRDTAEVQPRLLVPVIRYDTIDGKLCEIPPEKSMLKAGPATWKAMEGPRIILRPRGAGHDPATSAFGDVARASASLLYVPIRGSSGVLGIVSVHSYAYDAYTGDSLELLQTLIDHASGAVERTRSDDMNALLESAIRLTADMVFITGADPDSESGARIVFVNDAFLDHTGWERQEIIGQPPTVLIGPATAPEAMEAIRDALSNNRSIRIPLLNYRRDGTTYLAEMSAAPIMDAYGRARYFVCVQRDIGERAVTDHETLRDLFHDPLTGLPNRALLRERLEHALARRSRVEGTPFALLHVGLDGFAMVNRTHGHATGDQVLTRTAQRLEACVRPGDTVARVGGDEFVVILESVAEDSQVASAAARMMDVVRRPLTLSGRTIDCPASVGIVGPDKTVGDVDDVLAEAAANLRRAKVAAAGGR